MAVTAKLYGNAVLNAFKKTMDLSSDTIKVMLCTSSYTPNQDTHDFKDDVTNEVTGTGYTAGGATLTNKSLTYTANTNTIMFDADDVTWSNSTITARYAVIYDASPSTDATRPLIGYIDFTGGSPVDGISSTNGAFTIQWNASGIFTATVS
jgi:hypothetical protein